MIVERNDAIRIATLSGQLKDRAPVSQPMKTKTNDDDEALFNLGIDEVDQTSSKEKYANKPR